MEGTFIRKAVDFSLNDDQIWTRFQYQSYGWLMDIFILVHGAENGAKDGLVLMQRSYLLKTNEN